MRKQEPQVRASTPPSIAAPNFYSQIKLLRLVFVDRVVIQCSTRAPLGFSLFMHYVIDYRLMKLLSLYSLQMWVSHFLLFSPSWKYLDIICYLVLIVSVILYLRVTLAKEEIYCRARVVYW